MPSSPASASTLHLISRDSREGRGRGGEVNIWGGGEKLDNSGKRLGGAGGETEEDGRESWGGAGVGVGGADSVYDAIDMQGGEGLVIRGPGGHWRVAVGGVRRGGGRPRLSPSSSSVRKGGGGYLGWCGGGHRKARRNEIDAKEKGPAYR
jgi:hypothetical protein